jgi:hypothetical protein
MTCSNWAVEADLSVLPWFSLRRTKTEMISAAAEMAAVMYNTTESKLFLHDE